MTDQNRPEAQTNTVAVDSSVPPPSPEPRRVLGAAGTVSARPVRLSSPPSKPARAKRRRPANRSRIAIIGTGGMGTGHAHALMNFAGAGRENLQIAPSPTRATNAVRTATTPAPPSSPASMSSPPATTAKS